VTSRAVRVVDAFLAWGMVCLRGRLLARSVLFGLARTVPWPPSTSTTRSSSGSSLRVPTPMLSRYTATTAHRAACITPTDTCSLASSCSRSRSRSCVGLQNIAVSSGVTEADIAKLTEILNAIPEIQFICLDVANGTRAVLRCLCFCSVSRCSRTKRCQQRTEAARWLLFLTTTLAAPMACRLH